MKRIWLVSLAVIISLLFSSVPVMAASPNNNQSQAAIDRPHAEDVVLVGFVPGTPGAEKAGVRRAAGAVKAEPLSPLATNEEKLFLGQGVTVEQALANLQHNPNVTYAEPDYLLEAIDTSNDPYYTGGSLWGMYGDSTSPSNPYGSGAGEAWAKGYTGSRDVYVGVIDEGIQYTHPELAANVWTNPDDPVNGVDDDGNGKIDDVHGWDFYYNDNSVYDGTVDDHATHVAGTIGGEGGNDKGVAGVNWQVTLISTKFLGPNGGYTSGAVAALDYLTDLKKRHNLNIVATNNSWGGGGFSTSLLNAINRSADEGMLFVAAAGNNRTNTDRKPFYPACYQATTRYDNNQPRGYDAVISVAATTSTGGKASFSNYGASTVDIGAPGSGIYSTVPTDSYASYSGTSMATPHVTGAIALMASINPGLTAKQLREILMSSAAPTASLSGITITGGRLDIGAMVDLAAPNPGNQTPTANNQSVTANEDTAKAITLSGTDQETKELTFAIEDFPAHGSLGSISNNTGLSGTPNSDTADIIYTPVANYNGADSFTFAVNDGTASSTQATISITVNAVNDAPASSNNSVTTSQNTQEVFTTADFPFSDVDAGDSLQGIQVTTLEAAGALKLSGGDVTLDQEISAADITAGNLTFDPADNANGTPYTTFGFKVSDGTVYSASPYTMTINVTAVNQPTKVRVTSVAYYTQGGKDGKKHLYATVLLEDDTDQPVSNASVSATIENDSQSWSYIGITGIEGTVTFSIKNAPSGTYLTVIGGVTGDGLDWDDITPENVFTK